jgi:uncharacterized protein (TIGR02996 family)
MADHAAFMRAILAAPDDDLPRLVYADWLDERGDPRGEFIRVQLAIAGLADEPRSSTGLETGWPKVRDPRDARRFADLRAREEHLLHDHAWTWSAPLRSGGSGARFWRGFIDTVSCSAATFLAEAERWAESMAIRRLSLHGLGGHATALTASPLLARVQSLQLVWALETEEEHEDALLGLVRSPFAAGLRDLYVGWEIGDVAARAVLQSPHLTGLTTFAGWSRQLTPEVAYAMRRRFGRGW